MTTKNIETFGDLKKSGYQFVSVKEELRTNVINKLAKGETLFPGILGYEDSVIPQLINALLSCQDLILLGERGQAKSKILRGLTGLLDEAKPVLADAEIPESPFQPITTRGREILEQEGDRAKIQWLSPDDRYAEKLATPDIAIADLIGEIDPVKVAEGRYLADESSIHFGLIPRVNHGIFAINELPDLAERIQVGLLNVLEERDIQVRGFKIRLPLDVFLVVTANPEDYTNRGRLITPLKDRFGSQVRTHYPRTPEQELDIVKQEATALAMGERNLVVPEFMEKIAVEITHAARASSDVNQRSGVSVRTSITVYEAMLANAMRRALIKNEPHIVPRISDLPFIVPSLYGKLEFEVFDESEEDVVVEKLINSATRKVWEEYFDINQLEAVIDIFDRIDEIEVGVYQPIENYEQILESSPELKEACRLYGGSLGNPSDKSGNKNQSQIESAANPATLASELEFLLEGMYLQDLISKSSSQGRPTYRAKT